MTLMCAYIHAHVKLSNDIDLLFEKLEDIRHSQAFLSYSLKCLIETRARLQCYRPKISPRVKMLISVFLHGSSDRVRVISYNSGGICFFFIQFELNPVQPSLP